MRAEGEWQVRGSNLRWTITVRPHGRGAVSIRLSATPAFGAPCAICTEYGRPLLHSLSAEVAGPAGISEADACAEENQEETLDFTLSRPRSGGDGDGRLPDGGRQRDGSGGLRDGIGDADVRCERAGERRSA